MRQLVGIIGGKGKMGRYFANFFKKNGYEVVISDLHTKLSNKQLAKKADVVIVSVPIDETEEVINEVAPLVKKSGLLMDFTSVKMMPMQHLKKTKASYLGCHPLFGPTTGIQGQIVVLCPGRGIRWHHWLKDLLEKNQVIVRELKPDRHDELMSYIQTLNHFTEMVLADVLRKSGIPIKELMKYPSSVYTLELFMMGRILNQDPKLYANIQLSNPYNFKAVQSYLESARELAQTIEGKNLRKNIHFFEQGAEYLGDFAKIAMRESDRLLKYLRLPKERRMFEKKVSPKGFDIAVLGPQNTYSDMAAARYRKGIKVWYAASIPEVFDLVERGKVKEGLVPLENTSNGSVLETLDELYEGNVLIKEVIAQPVELALVGIKKIPYRKVKRIYSHTQPLLQCRQFIKKHFRGAETISTPSTTNALERVLLEAQEDHVAIASPIAAEAYNLPVIQKSIEDDKENTTYFAVIQKGKKVHADKRMKKTSIAFHFKKDSPGSLNAVLNLFADAGINLSKIESRPSRKVKGQYVFYLDFTRAYNEANSKKVLNQVEDLVANLKILGSY